MEIDKHKKEFGNLAEDYTKYRKLYPQELYSFLFSLTSGNNKILDIACGTGKSTESLLVEGGEVFGCDIDPLMISEAKKQAELKGLNINYSVASAENLLFKDGEFDVVTVGTAFHWFVNENAMSEIRRILKPGGLLFVFWGLSVKDTPEEDSIPSEFFQSYSWDKVPQELRDLNHISTFFNKNELINVNTHRIENVNNYTVDEYVGLMKTASSFGVLSENEKNRFVFELTDLLTKKLGNRQHFTLEDEIQICYGYKN